MRAAPEPVFLSWSGGKDSALALLHLQTSGRYRVAGLQTTVTDQHDRSSIHGLRRSLLRAQAEALGIALQEVVLPTPGSYESYEEAMLGALAAVKARGVVAVAFGDLCLEDVRQYREELLARAGMRAVFPLWGRDTRGVAEEVVQRGLRARIVVVDTEAVDGRIILGRPYDAALLKDLPADVDPAGENGEFHTFVSDGPAFCRPVAYDVGRVEKQGRFWYLDLVPR